MKFTVLMPVHDGVKSKELNLAVKSVLYSSLKPHEFLIIVDGKLDDKKYFFLEKLSKKKLVRIIFKKKIGLSKILNYGLKISKYDLVIRADSDDINHNNRFKEMVKYFKKYKLDILGSNISESFNGKKITKKMPEIPNIWHLLFYNPINHMSVIYNKKKILKLGGYPEIKFKEDYALWIKAKYNNLKIMNMQKNLVKTKVNNKVIERRSNYNSTMSEIKILKVFLSTFTLYFPISLLALMLRIIYLNLPNKIIYLIKKQFLRS